MDAPIPFAGCFADEPDPTALVEEVERYLREQRD